jgi:hypothetical protein
MNWVEGYINVIEVLLLIAIPALGILTLFSIWLAWRARPYRLAAVIAISNVIVGAAATWLAWSIIYRDQVGPVPPEALALTATATLALCTVPSMSTGYLAWIEARRSDRKRRRREDQDVGN